eukprot:scaffold59799_cov56-Cyclotella_meneghiniana.AAC.2
MDSQSSHMQHGTAKQDWLKAESTSTNNLAWLNKANRRRRHNPPTGSTAWSKEANKKHNSPPGEHGVGRFKTITQSNGSSVKGLITCRMTMLTTAN